MSQLTLYRNGRPRAAPWILALTIVFGAGACSTASPQTHLVVPPHPPDTIPAGLFDEVDPEYGVPADLLIVSFLPGLTPEEKSQLLGQVGVIAVIGGAPTETPEIMDGIYIVRLETDGDMVALLAARDRLRERAEVVSVGLYTRLHPG